MKTLTLRALLMASASALLVAACNTGTPSPTPATESTGGTSAAVASPASGAAPTSAPATAVPAATSAAAPKTDATASSQSVSSPAKPGADQQAMGEVSRVEDLQNINSFRFRASIKAQGKDSDGSDVNFAIEMRVAETRNPRASHMVIEAKDTPNNDGLSLPGGAIEFYQVENESYMKMGDMWIRGEMPMESFLSPEMFETPSDIARRVSNAQRIGTETVNGRSTTHYRFNRDAVLANATSFDPEVRELYAGLTDATVDVWIDEQEKFLVKMQMRSTGKQTLTSTFEGTMEVEYEVQDVNANFTITVPDAARQAMDLQLPTGSMPNIPTR